MKNAQDAQLLVREFLLTNEDYQKKLQEILENIENSAKMGLSNTSVPLSMCEQFSRSLVTELQERKFECENGGYFIKVKW